MSANEQFFDDAQTAVSLTGNSNSTVLLVPEPFRSEGAHRVGGQLRGDKERLFSGRVWRKVPESDARSSGAVSENRGGRPGLPVLMSLMVSVDVKQH